MVMNVVVSTIIAVVVSQFIVLKGITITVTSDVHLDIFYPKIKQEASSLYEARVSREVLAFTSWIHFKSSLFRLTTSYSYEILLWTISSSSGVPS
jgi:hypothetical protein